MIYDNIMTIFLAVLLGIIQGLTEFLPVSSSGHLLLVHHIFSLPNHTLLFDIILHIATLCAVLIIFRKKIWELVKNPLCKTNYCLLIATAITCTMVILFKDQIDKTLTYRVLPFTFLITAIILFTTTLITEKNQSGNNSGEVGYKTGIIAGIAQGIAVIPGISRSGSTIAASLFTGVKRQQAAEFAFLMSIPIILASFLFELISSPDDVLSVEPIPLLFGFAAALLSGIIAIKFMLKVVQNIKLYWFSAYLVVLSVILLFWF